MTDDPSTAARAYDRMAYFGHAFEQTHPDRLATIAALHGMTPAPVPRCRVLELGCADGGNLIPMACQWADSEFVGVDLSRRAVDKGAETVARLALRNIRLMRLDLMEIAAGFGEFDYIIAHGVYSWVPPAVRAHIMAILRDNLAPAGVAYVSYNAYPGSRLRDVARDMMLFHVREIADPQTRVDQARALLKSVAQASDETNLYGFLLHDQWERVRKMPDSRLYHDDLDEETRAFFLHQVVEEAGRHGLQYLSDAMSWLPDLAGEPETVAQMISQIPEDDVVRREQYLDFIKGRGFRATLLCHGQADLRRHIAPACIKDFQIAANVVPPDDDLDPGAPGVAAFTTVEGGTISVDHALSKAALLHLGTIWPQAVSFPDLVERACGLIDAARASEADVEALTAILFRMVGDGPVMLHLYPPRLTTDISERPQAGPLARLQAAEGPLITNLRHVAVLMEDETVRRFLRLVDGTRTVDQLVSELNEEAGRPEVTREEVERNLASMARLGLLVG